MLIYWIFSEASQLIFCLRKLSWLFRVQSEVGSQKSQLLSLNFPPGYPLKPDFLTVKVEKKNHHSQLHKFNIVAAYANSRKNVQLVICAPCVVWCVLLNNTDIEHWPGSVHKCAAAVFSTAEKWTLYCIASDAWTLYMTWGAKQSLLFLAFLTSTAGMW